MKQMMTMTRDVVLLASGMLALSAGAFSFTPSRFVGVYRDGENASFVSSNVAGSVEVTVCDGWLKPVLCKSLSADAVGVARLSVSFRDVGGRYGAYRVTFRASSGADFETWFAFLPGERQVPVRFYGTGSHAAHGWAHGEFRYLDLLVEAGIGAVRDDLYIEDWEDGAGGFKFPEKVAAYVRELNDRGIQLDCILCIRRPYTREKIDPKRFEHWAKFLTQAFRGKDVSFEIWNEPQNIAFKEVYGGTYHGPDAKWIPEFVTFTKAVKAAFKSAGCSHQVFLTAEDYLPALKPMIEMGIAEKGDIVSIHPYCHSNPRPEKGTWFMDDDGKSFRALAAAHGGCDRFCVTEAGWTTVSVTGKVDHAFVGNYPRVTYVEQAQYIIRMFTIARQIGLEQAFQYDFVNDGTNRFYTEHNFGLVNADYSPKPSYVAVAAHISILRDMEPKGDTGGAHDRLRLYRFQRKDGRLAYAAWAVEGTATTSIPIDLGTNYKMFDLFGNSVCRPRDGTLVLTESPVYLVSEP